MTQMHRNDKDRKLRENFNVFMFPLYFLSKNFSSKTQIFVQTSKIIHSCYTVIPNSTMSVMSQSSIKMTSMTHMNSLRVK